MKNIWQTKEILKAKKSDNTSEILHYAEEFTKIISNELQYMYKVEFAAGNRMALRIRYMTEVIQKALKLKGDETNV